MFSAVMVCAATPTDTPPAAAIRTANRYTYRQKTKPALQLFKTAKGNRIASSFFVMQMPDPKWGYNGVFFYADCGLNINPNSDQLAEIAGHDGETV